MKDFQILTNARRMLILTASAFCLPAAAATLNRQPQTPDMGFAKQQVQEQMVELRKK